MASAEYFALFPYLLSIGCALILARRSTNWRIRLLSFTVGLVPLCQTVQLLGRNRIWITKEVAEITEPLELLVGALLLTAIYLLQKENLDRKKTDVSLRI